jgi:hypothetical protein
VRRLGVVVLEPTTDLGQHGFGVSQFSAVHIVALERPMNASARPLLSGLYAGVVIGTSPELVRVQHGRRGGVLGTVVREPLDRVRGFERSLTEPRAVGLARCDYVEQMPAGQGQALN